jgi:glycosyltransferase involved in cell wall biosynthesis
MKKIKLQIEGWRGISHSYALVNQFQLLAWAQNPYLEIGHLDMPYFFDSWGKHKNPSGLTAKDESIIDQLVPLTEFDAVFRIYSPFDLKPAHRGRTGVFMVTEFGLDITTVNLQTIPALQSEGGFIVTPSHWSRNRLVANGIPAEMVHVVPHSVDPSYFHRLPDDLIAAQRKSLGFQTDEVILLNVGTQHWAKGMDLLIRAFAVARAQRKDLRLVLKDQRNTYTLNTEEFIGQTLAEHGLLSEDVLQAITMIPVNLTLQELNSLYNVADAYVSPYRAEGYNLPVREAQTCHTPVITTRDGATADFTRSNGNVMLEGTLNENASLKTEIPINAYIEPDFQQLCEALKKIDRKPHDIKHQSKNDLPSWKDCADLIVSYYC